MILVTASEVIVRQKDHDKVFALESIIGMETGHKVLLFPTILGGVACPLFLVAAFNNIGGLWIMMCLAFAGLLAVYYGLAGTDTLTLRTKVKDFDFFTDTLNSMLPIFCHFYNKVLVRGRLDNYFCVEISDDALAEGESKGIIKTPESGTLLRGIDEIGPATPGYKWFSILAPVSNGYRIGFIQKDPDHVEAMLFSDIQTAHLRRINTASN